MEEHQGRTLAGDVAGYLSFRDRNANYATGSLHTGAATSRVSGVSAACRTRHGATKLF